MYSRKVDEDEPTSRRVIGCAFEVGKVLETAFLNSIYLSKNIELIFIKSSAARGFPDSLYRRLPENDVPDWTGFRFVFKARQPAPA